MVLHSNSDTCCPINDKYECRDVEGALKNGDKYYWCKEDYQNFFKAFLNNEFLVEPFVKPQFISHESNEVIED